MTTPKEPPHSGRITQLALGYWPSRVLLAAVELGVFTALGASQRSLTTDELDGQLGLLAPSSADFYDSLVALGFLTQDDTGYRNTDESATFLDENSPSFARELFARANTENYRRWAGIAEVLRTGVLPSSMFEELDAEPDRLKAFAAAMATTMKSSFVALADAFDFASVESVCDVGGAAGDLVIELARRHPHLRCTIFDRPALGPLAHTAVAHAGVQDRVRFLAGDFFTHPLPRADVLVMSMVLLDWPANRKQSLIQAAHEALPDGGCFLVLDRLVEPPRGSSRRKLFELLRSLDALVSYGDAHHYTAEKLRGWCRASGFGTCDVQVLHGQISLAVSRKGSPEANAR